MNEATKQYRFTIGSAFKGANGQPQMSLDAEKLKAALAVNQDKYIKISMREQKFKKSEKSPDFSIECMNIYAKSTPHGWVPEYKKYQPNPMAGWNDSTKIEQWGAEPPPSFNDDDIMF